MEVVWYPSPHTQKRVTEDNVGGIHLNMFLKKGSRGHHVLSTLVSMASLCPWKYGHSSPDSNKYFTLLMTVVKKSLFTR